MFQVLFQVNKRPDFETMKAVGKRVNNENQSTVGLELLKYLKEERDKLYYMGIMPAKEVNKTYNSLPLFVSTRRAFVRYCRSFDRTAGSLKKISPLEAQYK